ncbi:rhamnogalacturonan lyase [Pedobacter frigidisoli]|uniref:Rhamnogalacturonan lyase n=1 Tax=Pedobacter frigidisoli TaxID=2530455 RepID=A0A4R0NVT2_9SPHI|nr:rhamnogalacturonan lyase [Pedobacter frigidisoli]TCD05621.1 rhamnogalacturonan lyase [Pedobacter frigidisoli]
MIKPIQYFLLLLISFSSISSFAQRQMEKLGRGVVAVRQNADSVFVSWRILGTEPDDIGFNLYRKTGNETAKKLNATPLIKGTNFIDVGFNANFDNSYFVKPILKATEQEASKSFVLAAKSPIQQYLTIPLRTPAGYTPNDASVGDLDGDGEYEIILHQTGRGRDNSSNGITDPPIFQAYKVDGTFLWEINLGKNIREGAHYTQFMVYDLDGDGIAEFACKTADGTIDGKGKVISDSPKDYRNKNGKILDGPEFFTIFSGKTGEALATTDYIPARGDIGAWGGKGGNGKNDDSGNRVDRFNACIAYLDGIHPSVVMCRGYYGRTVLAAWDWRNGKLISRWVFDSKDGRNPFSGMGNHNLTVADVDGDGKDEIIYGSMCVDDNGIGLYTTGLRHGDALHVSDLDPERPGLEVFGVHEIEEGTKGPGAALFDAKTGEILWHGSEDEDVGRGVADNIDNTRIGAQMWWSGSNGLFDMKGNRIGEQPRSTNFLIYWDGDLSRELLDGNHIDKYNGGRLLTANGAISNNWTKSTPALSADIFGDWREELILRAYDNQSLRIYTTTIPTEHRNYTLMHDPQYRLSIAWQNDGYNQPPHSGFYFGYGMKKAPKPNILLVEPQK